MKKQGEAGYNERLFSSGFRRRFHLARFIWAEQAVRKSGTPCRHVMELGCFDARSLSHLPREPERYLGLDEGREGGIDAARERLGDKQGFRFEVCSTPEGMNSAAAGERFDTFVCLETLEHVNPELVEPYIAEVARVLDGHLIVTVPNEKGPVFLVKYIFKSLFGDASSYRLREIFWAFTGQMHKIKRNEHKGFDYSVIAATVARHFDIVEVSPYPFRAFPRWLGFGVGILARARK